MKKVLDSIIEASQSPYGAKWFATFAKCTPSVATSTCRNPLTGLCGLQRTFFVTSALVAQAAVAIPLRG